MAINTLVRAMGMHWENEQRISNNESIAYTAEDFEDLVNENGVHHNGVISRWQHHY